MDRGAQPERTALAWRRTAVALLVALLVAARVVIGTGMPALIVMLGLALGLAVVLISFGHRRYLRSAAVLHSDGVGPSPHGPLPDGAALGALAALTMVVGLLSLGCLLLR